MPQLNTDYTIVTRMPQFYKSLNSFMHSGWDFEISDLDWLREPGGTTKINKISAQIDAVL